MQDKISLLNSDQGSFRQDVELGFLGFWTWDFKTEQFDPSENILCLLEKNADDVVPSPHARETMALRVHPDDIEWLKEERPRCFGPSGYGVIEYRAVDGQGRVRWLMCRGHYVVDDLGHLVRARGFLVDITEFKNDGNSSRIVPAPLPDPVKALVDAALMAHEAALQMGDLVIVEQTKRLLLQAGRALARDLTLKSGISLH